MPLNNNPLAEPAMPEAIPTDQDKEIQKMLEKLWAEKQQMRKQLQTMQFLFTSLESIQLLSRNVETPDPEFPDDENKRTRSVKYYKPRDIDNREMSDPRRDEVFQRCKPEYDAMFPA